MLLMKRQMVSWEYLLLDVDQGITELQTVWGATWQRRLDRNIILLYSIPIILQELRAYSCYIVVHQEELRNPA